MVSQTGAQCHRLQGRQVGPGRTCCSVGGGCSFIFSRQLFTALMALPMETASGRQATCTEVHAQQEE